MITKYTVIVAGRLSTSAENSGNQFLIPHVWFFFFSVPWILQPHRIKERLHPLPRAAHQRLGEALRGGAAAVRLHLQQREGHGGAGHPQPLLRPGGVQRGPAGYAEGGRLCLNVKKK